MDSAWPIYKNSPVFNQEQNRKFKFVVRCNKTMSHFLISNIPQQNKRIIYLGIFLMLSESEPYHYLNLLVGRLHCVGCFDAILVCSFQKTWNIDNSSEIIVFIWCVNTVYCWPCLKIFLVIDNEVYQWDMYSHGRGRTFVLLNRLLPEFIGCSPTIILRVFVQRVHFTVRWITRKIISDFITEWKQAK